MLMNILIVAHVIVALALVVVVLLQHGNQQGLSGAIAGGAETFFGKNKGRTIDAMLRKFTSVIAILFIAISLTLTVVVSREANIGTTEIASDAGTEGTDQTQTEPITLDVNGKTVVMDQSGVYDGEGNLLTMDQESGAVMTESGEVYATSEEMQSAWEAYMAEAQAQQPADDTAAPTVINVGDKAVIIDSNGVTDPDGNPLTVNQEDITNADGTVYVTMDEFEAAMEAQRAASNAGSETGAEAEIPASE